MSPVIRELQAQSVPFSLILSGQHYDYNMSLQFIRELRLPKVNYSLKLRSETPARQMGEMMMKLGEVLRGRKNEMLCVHGDTNTTLTAALVGVKVGMKVAHVEAGLRSYDWRMPEEHNRRLADHLSDTLFAPTSVAKKNLIAERVYGRIHVTGNTVIDAVSQNMPIAKERAGITRSIVFKEFCLVTLHRAENVDDDGTLKEIISALIDSPLPVVFPAHPRTIEGLRRIKMLDTVRSSRNVQLVSPLGYFDFLCLMSRCKMILTDSGGIQEEATAMCIRKPVLILRRSTERPEAVDAGFAKLAGVHKSTILRELDKSLQKKCSLPSYSPFGDGMASKRIVRIIKESLSYQCQTKRSSQRIDQ